MDGKLVRDQIPEIIRATGHVPETRVLSPREFRQALLAKLLEEVAETVAAVDREERIGELVDVFEVLRSLVLDAGIAWADFEQLVDDKRAIRGGFSCRIWLGHS